MNIINQKKYDKESQNENFIKIYGNKKLQPNSKKKKNTPETL